MYYPCSENKGADQLRGYREADLRLCFRICRLLVFPPGGSFIIYRGPSGIFVSFQASMELFHFHTLHEFFEYPVHQDNVC